MSFGNVEEMFKRKREESEERKREEEREEGFKKSRLLQISLTKTKRGGRRI